MDSLLHICKVKSTIIESQYFGQISFWALFIQSEHFIVEQNEHYQKRSFRNKTIIGTGNGPMTLSVPLKSGKHHQTNIRDVQISYDENWPKSHWLSIRSAYGNAPYFEYYADDFKSLFHQRPQYLFDWNLMTLRNIKRLLQIDKTMYFSSSFYHVVQGTEDYRDYFKPGEKHKYKLDMQIRYGQVFEDRFGFNPTLGILDLLFCTGPEAILLLQKANVK